MVKISESLSNFLNLIRWIAAFLVVITHIRTLLFIDIEKVSNSNIFISFFYFISSLGGEAVIVFFVLSGYLVGGKTFYEFKNSSFNWKIYFINRFSRLYIVLIPALIIGGFIDYLGINYFNANQIYNNAFNLVPFNYDIESRLNVYTFISNIFMMQTTLTPQFGSNGPLWSLANEFWYYVLFPLILNTYFSKNFRNKLFSFLTIIVISLFLNIDIILHFFIWLIGVYTYTYKKNILNFKFSFSIFIFVLILNYFDFFPYSKLEALSLALAISLMIISISKNINFVKFKKINIVLADSSYSLYLFHDPLLLFISLYFSFPFKQDFSIHGLYIFFSLLIFLYFYSFFMYFIFERNTHILRNNLRKAFA